MKEKAPKVKKIRNGNKSPFKGVAFTLISLVLAVLVYVGFIYAQRFLDTNTVLTAVLVAKEDIPVNTMITVENVDQFFENKSVDLTLVPKTAIKNKSETIGLKIGYAVSKNEIIVSKAFSNSAANQKQFEDPVEMTISVSNIADAVGGKIRSGDVINITFSKKYSDGSKGNVSNVRTVNSGTDQLPDKNNGYATDTYDAVTILENIYVTTVYDSAGEEIAISDTTLNASVIQFTVEREEANALDRVLMNSDKLRVSRTVYDK